MIAAAERELALRSERAKVVSGPQTEQEADWAEENARFWLRFEWEDEAKAEAEEEVEARLALPEHKLSREEAAAARLLSEAKRERDRYKERYHRRKQRDGQLAERGPRQDRAAGFWTRPALTPPPVTITAMFEGYAGQGGTRPTTVKQFRSIITHLVTFLGHNDATAVVLKDLVRWREHLRTEVVNEGKARSAKTINDSYLAAVHAVFTYGLNQLLIPANPARELAKVKAPKPLKLREKDFTREERRKILQAALEEGSDKLSPERALARRWVPWLCAYTGARVNEMTQLRKEDVREIDGVWTIHITPEAGGVKTNEARTVPLHEHLLAQGFIEVVTSKPEGPLFYNPGLARGGSERGQHKKVGMFLAKWVRKSVGVTDPDILPNHAWRHTFKGLCLEYGIEERAADYMQGHSPKGQGRRYGPNTIPALATQLAKFSRFEFA